MYFSAFRYRQCSFPSQRKLRLHIMSKESECFINHKPHIPRYRNTTSKRILLINFSLPNFTSTSTSPFLYALGIMLMLTIIYNTLCCAYMGDTLELVSSPPQT
jgi:hypothetical protein